MDENMVALSSMLQKGLERRTLSVLAAALVFESLIQLHTIKLPNA
jgi:hypothetical protein